MRGLARYPVLAPLTGGSIQENWGFDAHFEGGTLDGEHRLVLRAAGETGVPSSLDRLQEFAVLKAAFVAGVTVPEPLFACPDSSVFGKPFFIMRRAEGTAAAHRITRDPTLDSGVAGDRRTARPRAGPHPHNPAAASRSRFSDPIREIQAHTPNRRLSPLSRYPPLAAPSTRMGNTLARNPRPAGGRAGAMPSRFPHRQLFARWRQADRDPRLGICRLGRPARGHRLVLQQGLAVRAARPGSRRYRRPLTVLSWLREREPPRNRPGPGSFLGGVGERAVGDYRAAAK